MSDVSAIRDKVVGRAVPIRGNELDTDRIIPARYLKEITFEHMGDYLFYDERFNQDGSEKDYPLNDVRFKGASIMVVENNFGCGSSREHAPQAILRHGFQALIGESFAEIFAGNCKALGMPALTASKSDIARLLTHIESYPEVELTLDVALKTVHFGEETINLDLHDARRQAFLEGTWDELSLLKGNVDKITEVTNRLPYFK
ncbi:3-isopropylmalate dehydratase small subunit [Candidatus Marinamargulisbacteria bacterium SCGC AG-439-L15]|nr:3-isopropylmalate dehydratase small subunit [Candidatus Marinamargulisbacteria bacterium SCGC AG-439-L15]